MIFQFNKVPPLKKLYKTVSKNVLRPNTAFTYELWYSRLIGRRLSIYFTWLLLHTNITPNQLTVIHSFFSIGGSALLAIPSKNVLLAGTLFFNLYLILDSSDGEIARYKKQTSALGGYLDTLSHIAIYSTLYTAIGVNIYLRTSNFTAIILGLTTALLFSIASAIHHLDPLLKNMHYTKMREGENKLIFIGTNIYQFITEDLTLVAYVFIFGLLNYPSILGYDPYTLILAINFLLILFGGILFNLTKKILDKRYH